MTDAARRRDVAEIDAYLSRSTDPEVLHGFLQGSGVVDDAERAAVDTARSFGAAIRSRRVTLAYDQPRE